MRCATCGQKLEAEAPSDGLAFCASACEAYQGLKGQGRLRLLDVFWGGWTVWTRPGLIALSLLSLFLTALLLGLTLVFSFQRFYAWFNAWLEQVASSAQALPLLQILVVSFSTFSVLVLSLVLFLPVAALVTMPFMDPLVAKIEARQLGEARPAVPFHLPTLLREMLRLLGLKLLLLLPLLLFWVPVLGPLLVLFSLALVLSLDFLDLLWMRKGYAFADKLRFLRQNALGWLLFTLPLMLMLWVPVLQLLMLPAASAGAVRWFLVAKK